MYLKIQVLKFSQRFQKTDTLPGTRNSRFTPTTGIPLTWCRKGGTPRWASRKVAGERPLWRHIPRWRHSREVEEICGFTSPTTRTPWFVCFLFKHHFYFLILWLILLPSYCWWTTIQIFNKVMKGHISKSNIYFYSK